MTRYPIPRDVTTPCAADPSLFFAPSHREAEQEQTERVGKARAVCAGCPWARGCLAYALHWAVEGVWAGTTLAEREQLRRRTGQEARPLMDGRGSYGWGLEPHGTEAGWQRHKRAGESPCGPCIAGASRALARRRSRVGGAA